MKNLVFHIAALALFASDSGAIAQEQQGAAALPSDDEKIRDEIVVIAQKANRVRIKFKIDDRTRRARCKIVRSSGDKAFDKTMCQPVYRCASVEPFDETTVRSCMDRAREDVLREWAESHNS